MVELPRMRRSITIADRTWRVETVEDQDALLSASQNRAQFPFGLMLWESAIALAEVVAERRDQLSDRTVLELGCGIGLSGAVAASLGARVTQTDHDAAALAASARTADLNGVTGIQLAIGDWHDWRVPGRYELILGADVSYDAADHVGLLDVLNRTLAPGGTALLADPARAAQAEFIAAAKVCGWAIHASERQVADLKSRDPSATLTITILELRQTASNA